MNNYGTPMIDSSTKPFDKSKWDYYQNYETPSYIKTKCLKIDKFVKLVSQMMKRDERLKTLVTAQNLKYMTMVIFNGDKKNKFFTMADEFLLSQGVTNLLQGYAEVGYARINKLQSEKFLPYVMLNAEWHPESDEFELDIEVRKLFVQENPKNDQILEVIYEIIESSAKTAGIRLKKVRITPNAHEVGKSGKVEWCKGLWKGKL